MFDLIFSLCSLSFKYLIHISIKSLDILVNIIIFLDNLLNMKYFRIYIKILNSIKIIMTQCLKYTEIDLSNIVYKAPIKKESNIFYNNKENKGSLLTSTPLLKIKKIIDNSIVFEISKSNLDFVNFIKNLDELNISNCYYNSKEWFKKDISLDIIQKYYKSPINKDSFEIQLDLNLNSENIVELDYILDENNDYISLLNLKEDDMVSLRIKYNAMKFSAKTFKPILIIKSIKKHNVLDNNLYNESDLDSDSDLSDNELSDDNEF